MRFGRAVLPAAPFPNARSILFTVLGFFLLAFFVYGRTLPHSFVTLNDPELISQNPIVQSISWTTFKSAFTTFDPELYIPFTFLSYQFDWWIGHGSAFAFHIDNLLLHVLDALLVVWLMYKLSKNRWIGIMCGLVFLVHPIGTEAVMWVSARKDVLSTFFGRSSFIAYMYYLEKKRPARLYGSAALFLCALLAKVKVILLPLSMLLVDWREGRPWRWGLLIEKIPYIVLSIFFGWIGFSAKEDLIGASSVSTKIFLGVKSFALYLQHYFVPVGFSIYYPWMKPVTFLSADFLWPLLLGMLLIGLAFYSLRWTREVFFGIGLFCLGTIAGFSNLAKGPDLFLGSDRYPYTALIGITYTIASAVALAILLSKPHVQPTLKKLSMGAALVVVAGLSFLAYNQSRVWANSVSLYTHAISLQPDFYLPYYDLGVAYEAIDDDTSAITAYKESLKRLPGYPRAAVNLGHMYYELAQRTEAREQFSIALKTDPHFAMAHFDLAVMDDEDGNVASAIDQYRKAIEAEPTFLDARLNLAALEAKNGKYADAIKDLQGAVTLDPENERTLALVAEFLQQGIIDRQGNLLKK